MIHNLAYIGFRSPAVDEWRTFGPEILGMQLADDGIGLAIQGHDAALEVVALLDFHRPRQCLTEPLQLRVTFLQPVGGVHDRSSPGSQRSHSSTADAMRSRGRI